MRDKPKPSPSHVGTPMRRASDLAWIRDRAHPAAIADRARDAVMAREDERRRLAADLHDCVGTNLATIKMGLELLGRSLPADATREAAQLADTRELLAETIANVRELCASLHPVALARQSFVDSLRAHCLRFGRQVGIEIDLDLAAHVEPCAADVELMLLRVSQEALWNCAKHARADHVRIAIEAVGSRRRLHICDDGCGFDPAQLGADAAGIGIAAMCDRALAVGAKFQLDSSPGGGTRISVEF
ncbi:MAG: sensor histidine kinase [Burkholderiaceae bacterium]